MLQINEYEGDRDGERANFDLTENIETMNILLVEDDEILLKALSFKLTEKGNQVYQARDGKRAVDVVLDYPVDLIICDLMIPIISGATFLRMRRKFMSLSIPVIVMSSLKNGEEILKNLGVDFMFFVKKPVNFENLIDLVEQSQIQSQPVG
jgi:DNA-binding response OmpR family regulator